MFKYIKKKRKEYWDKRFLEMDKEIHENSVLLKEGDILSCDRNGLYLNGVIIIKEDN